MTKTRDLANLIADSKVGPSEIDTTGTYNMNALQVGGTTVIDSSQNIGVGVAPDTRWTSTYSHIDLDTGGAVYGTSTGVSLSANLYFDGSNWKNKVGGSGGNLMANYNGGYYFYKTTSQTNADTTVSLSERLRVDDNVDLRNGTSLQIGGTTVIDSSRNLLDVRRLVIEGDSTSGGLKNEFKQAGTGGGDYSIMVTNNGNGSLGGGKFAILDNAASGNNLAQTRLMIDASGSVTVPGKLVTTAPSNPELLTNGTFSNGTTGWTAHSSTLSVSNGQLSVADNGGYSKAWQAITTVVNEAYELTFTGVSATGQSLVVGISGTPVNSNTWGDIRAFAYSSSELPVTHSHVFKATTTTTYISLGSEGSNTAVFDNVSIKKVALDDNQVLTQADLAPQLEGLGLKIDAAGRITTQYHPAFTAQPTSFTGSGGIAGTQTFIFATTLLNRGGHFDTSNGRFTAPAAGNYFFTYSITAASSSKNARYFRVRLKKNGAVTFNPHNTISDETNNADYNFVSASGLVDMEVGDYVELEYGSSIDASGLAFYDTMNVFSGFLLS